MLINLIVICALIIICALINICDLIINICDLIIHVCDLIMYIYVLINYQYLCFCFGLKQSFVIHETLRKFAKKMLFTFNEKEKIQINTMENF